MTSQEPRGRALETAHVLFVDVVAYSRLPVDRQERLLDTLQELVRKTTDFPLASSTGQLLCLPTGDGMALVFFADPEAPARCAVELSRFLRDHPEIKVRMGIHTGPVYRISDINANLNVAGGGINIAQRVMACGDGDHILLSKQSADILGQVSRWNGLFHDLGVVRVKHGTPVHLFNLYAVDFGNPERPRKVSARRLHIWLGAGLTALAALAALICLIVWRSRPEDVLLSEWGKPIGLASISSDGLTIAFESDATGQSEIYVVRTKGGKPRQRTAGPGDKRDPRIKPDGTAILYARVAETSEIWTVPPEDDGSQKLISDATCADWSPDGGRIVYARERTGETASLRVYDLSGGTEGSPIYTSKFEQITLVRWSPNGEWIFLSDGAGPRLIKPGGGALVKLPDELDDEDDVTWSRDGKYLFYSKLQQGRLAIWRVRVPDGKPQPVLAGAGEYFCPVASPVEDALIYAHGRIQWKLLAQSTGNQEPIELVSAVSGGMLSDPAISPDGDRALFIENENRSVLTVHMAGGDRLVVAGEGEHSNPIWSRDGKRVAYSKLVPQRQEKYWHIFIKPFGERSPSQQKSQGEFDAYPSDWSSSGDALLFTRKVRGRQALMTLDISTGKASLVREGLDSGKYSTDGRWLLALGPLDMPELRGLWVVSSKGEKSTRITSDAVVRAKWALSDRAVVYSVQRKEQGRVNLWKGSIEGGQSLGRASLLFSYPAAGGADQWDVTDDLSKILYVQTEQSGDLYKRTPLK